MIDPIEIMKQAYAENYQGSITELIMQGEAEAMAQEQAVAQEMGMDVASTPQEQQVGLTEGPPRPMAFPNTGGQDFNTMGMDYPVDMQGFDSQGGLVRSYEAVPPGINSIPMGPKVDTVIENPTQYQNGGFYNQKRADELNYKKDATNHLPSVDEETGFFLKSDEHPTFHKEVEWFNSQPNTAPFGPHTHNLVKDTTGFFKQHQWRYTPKKQLGGVSVQYRAGGVVERPLKDLSFSEKIERYRKSKRK